MLWLKIKSLSDELTLSIIPRRMVITRNTIKPEAENSERTDLTGQIHEVPSHKQIVELEESNVKATTTSNSTAIHINDIPEAMRTLAIDDTSQVPHPVKSSEVCQARKLVFEERSQMLKSW